MIRVVNRRNYRGHDAVYVGRGTPLGNPYSHLPTGSSQAKFKVETRDEAVDKYAEWLPDAMKTDPMVRKVFEGLVQFYRDFGELTLSCYCAPKRCHAEVIARMVQEAVGEAA